MKLINKVALITGAGSGIGQAAAALFAAEGASVMAVDVDASGAEETVAAISRNGRKALALRADVSSARDTQKMVETTVERMGSLDILFNNAGIVGEAGFLAQMSEEAFDRVIAVNLRGVFLGMKYALPQMVKQGGGSIINQASIAGLVGVRGSAGYCAAKAAVIELTRVAALEYGRYKIRVNCICPGLIDTPMARSLGGSTLDPANPQVINRVSVLRRLGKPEEIAKMALFLASDDSAFATGAPFIVDGGWTAS